MHNLSVAIIRQANVDTLIDPSTEEPYSVPRPAIVRVNGVVFVSEHPINAGDAESINQAAADVLEVAGSERGRLCK